MGGGDGPCRWILSARVTPVEPSGLQGDCKGVPLSGAEASLSRL